MIQTRVVSENSKQFQDTLNKALNELSNHEIVDVKFAVNNEPVTDMETFTALILYKS
ncbi:sporulation protein Cse60 [Cytobacillus pseudoceanisediminis]